MRTFAVRSAQVLVDLLVLAVAFGVAFLARFDGVPPLEMTKRLLFLWPYVVGFQYGLLVAWGVPRFAWRYFGFREIRSVAYALGVAAAALLIARYGGASFVRAWGYAKYLTVPTSIILIDLALALVGIAGVRGIRRFQVERRNRGNAVSLKPHRVRTVLVGAGSAGAMVAREIEARPDLRIEPVAFLDDDPSKRGLVIHGIRVRGGLPELARVAASTRAQQVLISIAGARSEMVRAVMHAAEKAGLEVRVIPSLFEILDGKVNLSRIRPVSIDDLLGRPPVTLDMPELERFVKGKRVLVTGAGGSIGSELCRQISRFAPESLSLVERAEFHLFTIHQELLNSFPELLILPRICDVCDSKRLDAVFSDDRPEVVFHAAAHKHVPMMEWNPGEAIKNNVFGTKKVADAADRHGCGAFVLISTDKAVNPTSVMGATKRVAEMYVQALSQRSKTKYVAVRFGNVLGSAGSVVPVFQKQIEEGGPVKVTHPEMKRYFMTIPEACQLVIQAAAMGRGGEIFVLDMGTPMKIVDLARDLIRLSGFEPEVDIKIEFTGMRPGEKLFEELGFDAEKMDKTRHPKIFVGRLSPVAMERVEQGLSGLKDLTSSRIAAEIRGALSVLVPEMQPGGSSHPPPKTQASARASLVSQVGD